MTQRITKQPDLSETLEWLFEQKFSQLFIALPGKVVDYYPNEQIADIQPMLTHNLQTIDGEELNEKIEILSSVPVVFPRGGGFFMSYPLKVDDKVLLVFNDRSIDQYIRSQDQEEPINPLNLESHGPNGAVAIPGFYPLTQSLSTDDANNSDMMIGQAGGGMKIRIKDTEINIESNNSAPHPAVFGDILKTFWTNFKGVFDSHIHPTGVGPSGSTATPAPEYDDNINSTKFKLPGN